MRARERQRRAGHMMDAEIRHDGVKARLGVRRCLGVTDIEPDGGQPAARLIQHWRGKIEARHKRAPRRGGARDEPGPAAHVQHSGAWNDRHRVQQRLDELPCRRGECRLIARGRAIPSRALERPHRLGIERHRQ